MAITQAPLLSLGASGTVAKTITYGKWKGRRFARGYAVPSREKSEAQVRTRQVFKWLGNVWIIAPILLRAPWDQFAHDKPVYGKNVWIAQNMPLLRPGNDINSWLGCPGLNYAPGLPSMVVFGSPNQLAAVFALPDVPDGWVFQAKVMAAIQTQNPQTDTLHQSRANEQLNPAGNAFVTPLLPLTEYAVSVWIRWARPDGSIAYSRGLSGIGTTL